MQQIIKSKLKKYNIMKRQPHIIQQHRGKLWDRSKAIMVQPNKERSIIMENKKKDEIEIKREWIIEAVRKAEPGDILILERVILVLTK